MGLLGKWAIPVIAVLILGALGFSQDAQAACVTPETAQALVGRGTHVYLD